MGDIKNKIILPMKYKEVCETEIIIKKLNTQNIDCIYIKDTSFIDISLLKIKESSG